MENKEIKMYLNEDGEITIPIKDRAVLVPIIKGLAMFNCDKVGCESCSLDLGYHGCALLLVETELKDMLLR